VINSSFSLVVLFNYYYFVHSHLVRCCYEVHYVHCYRYHSLTVHRYYVVPPIYLLPYTVPVLLWVQSSLHLWKPASQQHYFFIFIILGLQTAARFLVCLDGLIRPIVLWLPFFIILGDSISILNLKLFHFIFISLTVFLRLSEVGLLLVVVYLFPFFRNQLG
jgi:hypothetical protein